MFKSTVVAPAAAGANNNNNTDGDDDDTRRKYLAVAPDGRFMAVLKQSMLVETEGYRKKWTCVFLDEARQVWEEQRDIGDAAIFVGINSSLCVSTKGLPPGGGIRSGCVYFTDDDIGKSLQHRETYSSYRDADDELKWAGLYCLRSGRVEKIVMDKDHPRSPLPVWFTPSAF
ncbi:hypothetical protein PR202_gb27457 [Eleusine coracana subsp. coracana]|uniref:KIB1-4 beta-propeller domain-containing protein n=1 Tax=Eleusine coracana subsp. coracana TaxID=191504 RepID=A0AAV5FUK4_ELECO|nr:hypothetical protein PR202_gb27457 [Eleusine coracana subsp. coracana]